LYFNWNKLPAETFGTFSCKPKILEKILGKQISMGEVKGIELWRKYSKME
jgi:hypothetical protein